MSSKSTIEWTESTWNPVTGCNEVSEGCRHCYARRIDERFGRDFHHVVCHEDRLTLPLKWRKPRMVFVNSMSDLFHEKVPFEFIDKVFAVMAMARRHTFQVLTKRPQRMAEYTTYRHDIIGAVTKLGGLECEGCMPLQNVWLGTSCEDQPNYEERVRWLRQCIASVRFLSLEPLLDRIFLLRPPHDWGSFGLAWSESNCHYDRLAPPFIHWVIVGGESGPGARPMKREWVQEILLQCRIAAVPFFFKQWGGVRKSVNGRVLNGRTYDGMPKVAVAERR